MADTCYTVVAADDERDVGSIQDIKTQLESPKDDVKIEAMKKLLVLMLNGDPAPTLLMHIIRFVTPSKNKTLKKLALIYWEICPKYQANGKLKQEMVLVWWVGPIFLKTDGNSRVPVFCLPCRISELTNESSTKHQQRDS